MDKRNASRGCKALRQGMLHNLEASVNYADMVYMTSSINTCHIANTGELDVFGLLSGWVGILLIV